MTEAELKKKKKAEAEKRKSELLAEAVAKRLAEVQNAKGDSAAKADPVVTVTKKKDGDEEDTLKDSDEVGVFS